MYVYTNYKYIHKIKYDVWDRNCFLFIYGHVQITNNHSPTSPLPLFEIKETLTGLPVNVTNEFGHSVVPWRHYRRTHGDGYMCTIPASYPHTMEWNLPIEHEVDITSYSAGKKNQKQFWLIIVMLIM